MTAKPAISTSVSRKAASIEALQPVYELVQNDFAKVNALIPERLSSAVALVEEIGAYIVESGGKRLRPLMVLLTTGALGYNGHKHIHLAAVIEFLHTATLLHDDVVDDSGMRRGKVTANERWGNPHSVLVGDFLYSRAFQLMVEIGSMEIMRVLSAATNTIAEGEVMQLANVGNIELTETQYREVIRCKTALLFEAATHTGALLATASQIDVTNSQSADTQTLPPAVKAMRDFGLHFGVTYQLVDDWLDYAGDSATLGKNVGDDLAEGKLTLPLIYALKNAPPVDQEIVRCAIAQQSTAQLEQIIRIVQECGALDYTHEAALAETEKAKACLALLPDGPYVEACKILTDYSTARLY